MDVGVCILHCKGHILTPSFSPVIWIGWNMLAGAFPPPLYPSVAQKDFCAKILLGLFQSSVWGSVPCRMKRDSSDRLDMTAHHSMELAFLFKGKRMCWSWVPFWSSVMRISRIHNTVLLLDGAFISYSFIFFYFFYAFTTFLLSVRLLCW